MGGKALTGRPGSKHGNEESYPLSLLIVDSIASTKPESLTQLFPGVFITAPGGRIEVNITALPTQGLALDDLCLELMFSKVDVFG